MSSAVRRQPSLDMASAFIFWRSGRSHMPSSAYAAPVIRNAVTMARNVFFMLLKFIVGYKVSNNQNNVGSSAFGWKESLCHGVSPYFLMASR